MNSFFKFTAVFLLSLQAPFFVSCSSGTGGTGSGNTDYTAYVDPMIGAAGHGHVFIGASVPFGMVQAGPQNIYKGWDWCSGYHYSDSVVIGFSQTHLSGTGCGDMGDILLMPYMGKIRTLRGEQKNIEGSCASYYSHKNEKTAPGYYSLKMDNDIQVEITATERTAMYRFTFPKGEQHLLVNLKDGNRDKALATFVRKVDDKTIEGCRYSKGWSTHKVFFVMQFKQPIQEMHVFEGDEPAGKDNLEGTGVKAVLTFKDAPEVVDGKIAISSVSCDNARLNLQAESKGWNFEKIYADAKAKWNNQLSRVSVTSDDESAKRVFYTSMYHTFIAPTLYSDVNGEFLGHDGKIHKADWANYTTLSLWDTYRTWSPLLTIIGPEYMDDIVNSMLSIYDQQGKLPIWPLVGTETNCMPGYSAVPIIADVYLKGFKGFDPERALKYMVSSTTNPKQRGVRYILEMDYIPCDKVWDGTSVAMEYAVGDMGVALMAKKMGKEDVYRTYSKRAFFHELYFDKNINFFRPKKKDGSWRTPYSPFRSGHGDFCEGNGWQYSFFVPHYPEGLVSLMGGDESFVKKLDSLFIVTGDMSKNAAVDITGLIGMYAHGNEPSHHVAYMYPYAGQQWKTAEKVRYILREFYTDKPDGLIGNEDCGQMSAWYVMSAMGFYQVNPSNGVLVFGSPKFPKMEIRLPEGKTFTVIAENNSEENIYIQSVTLNGKPYTKTYITYEDVMRGGNLTFSMGNTPNRQFGTAPADRPVSAK